MNENFIALAKKLLLMISLIISFSFFLTFPSCSQVINIFSNNSLAEKIYLQLDGKVYTTNQTIWFKSIVTNAIDNAPTTLSGVLYVELIGPDEKIIEKKLIKLEHGIGNGFFDLNQRYAQGAYLVRAYTEWNKNFDEGFIFKEYIQVFAPSTKLKTEPINNIILVKKQNNEHRLKADLDPFAIDSLHKKELTLFITIDNIKDSITIKRNGDNKYMIDYAIPNECQFVTLQMQTKNLCNYSKTIALNEDHFDLQFFPESGELVQGLRSKVGFKALDYNGKGKSAEGEIVNGEGDVITPFKSNQLGMGSFILTRVDSNTTYFAKLSSQAEERLSLMFPLPKIAKQGNVLSVINNGNEILINASSNYLKNDTVYFRISCRGVVLFDIKERLKQGIIALTVPTKELPEGIIAFTMMDKPMHLVAERLYFNERPENRINITISTDKKSYTQRELTKLDIETKNNAGEPVNANLSLLVVNKEQLGQIQGTRQNILSYFLLDSELKGEIENPGFYFSKGQNRHNDLDALLLTQGWRKYLYNKPVDKIHFQPEAKLTLSGTVGGLLFQKKKKKDIELTMMTFGNTKSIQTLRTDSLGRFNFNVDDEYGQNLNVLIQSANHYGQKKDYSITLNKKSSPSISFNHILSIGKIDSVVHALVAKDIERKKLEDALRLTSGDILLDEVVVEAYRMTPDRKKVMNEYGKPNVVISGKAIQEKEEKWSYGLYSVLLFNFPDKVVINRARDGNLYARLNNPEMTLVVIDGIPVIYYEYPFIPNIPPSEVKSFEIIEYAKNFSKLYLEVFPQASPFDAPVWGNVIAIYTYAGNGIYGAKRSVGLLQAAVPVFSTPREFYAPKYENIQSSDWSIPDLRALVHWQPKLVVDSLGKASTTFYNADNIGEMKVVVEAISEKGEIGYQELDYKVSKNQ